MFDSAYRHRPRTRPSPVAWDAACARLLADHERDGLLTVAALTREALALNVAPSSLVMRYREYVGRLAENIQMSQPDIEAIASSPDLVDAAELLAQLGSPIPLAVLQRLLPRVPGRDLSGLLGRVSRRKSALRGIQSSGISAAKRGEIR